MKKYLVIILIIAGITAVSWIFFSPEEDSQMQKITEFTSKRPVTQKSGQFQPYFLSPPLSDKESGIENSEPETKESEELFINPGLDSFQEIGSLMEDIGSAFGGSSEPQIPEIKQEPQSQEPIENIDLSAIELEIFNTLYPDYFIAGLLDTQEFFIEQEFLNTNYEKIENFDSEEKIFAFVNTTIDVFEEQGIYSTDDAKKFRIGANLTWKELLEVEKMQLRQELIGSEFYKGIFANRLYHLRKSTSKKIISIFETIKNLTATEAYAADCYRSGAATPGGSNVWASCCNCGYNTDGRHVWYVEDCGSRCNLENLGCLNGVAGGSRPAIWDSSTGICGVG